MSLTLTFLEQKAEITAEAYVERWHFSLSLSPSKLTYIKWLTFPFESWKKKTTMRLVIIFIIFSDIPHVILIAVLINILFQFRRYTTNYWYKVCAISKFFTW